MADKGATIMETAKVLLPKASSTTMALSVVWGSAILKYYKAKNSRKN